MFFRFLLMQRDFIKSGLILLLFFALIFSLMQRVYALGVGEVQTQSYIGEPFSAWVPLLNIQNANDIQVEITESSIVPTSSSGFLSSQIVEVDNQLNLRITSDQPVNEPYLMFSLQLTELNQVVSRDFTVLLEIQPALQAQNGYATPLNSAQGNTGAVTFVNTPAILGPYDYAVRGQIPRQFGAVLDGQSLWRVARRINEAMGVSINQMMWALYVHNPDAFATESVDSLRAGEYLNIPSFSEVASIGDTQALANLERLSTGQFVSSTQTNAVIESEQSSPSNVDIPQTGLVNEPVAAAESGLIETDDGNENPDDSFRLSGLDEFNSSESDEQSIEVINSLAETVGNLTQEIIRKDKQIEFLEEKVLALESIAALDASNANEPPASAGVTLANNTAGIISNTTSNEGSNIFKPWMVWIALLSLALLATLFLRKRFANVFGRNEDIEFEQRPMTTGNSNVNQGPQIQSPIKDYSSLAVVKKNDEDESDGFSYISVNDSVDESSLDVEEFDEQSESFITVEEEDFEGYLASLIESKRYDSALEFLDNQRSSMIDEDRYHLERLGIYFLQRDKEAFYAYYDEIETTIQHFGDAANRRISEMVVALEEQV